jgi:hypothetical protein
MNATAFKAAPFYNKLAKVLFILIALTYIAEQTL